MAGHRADHGIGGLIVLAAILADILLKKSSAVPERVEQAA